MGNLQIDIAYADYEHHRDPGVVLVENAAFSTVALFDAWGSWGSGMEAAANARAVLSERWLAAPPTSLEQATSDVLEVAHSTLERLLDAEFGCEFDGVVLGLHEDLVEVAACGTLGVALVSPTQSRMVFKPRMLIDDYIEQRELSAAEIEAFPDVCIGPYLASSVADPFARSGPHSLDVGCVLVVAGLRLMQDLLNRDSTSWLSWSAAQARACAEDPRVSRCPLILVRHA